MATQLLVSLEEYLRTSFEHDREYVRGELVERGMPTFLHGQTQMRIGVAVESARLHGADLHAASEVRNRLAEDVFRIPDVAIYSPRPAGPIPSVPPLAVVEIISPDDRYSALIEKCREYLAWGVAHIWIVDPQNRALYEFDDGSLKRLPALELPQHGLSIPANSLFD